MFKEGTFLRYAQDDGGARCSKRGRSIATLRRTWVFVTFRYCVARARDGSGYTAGGAIIGNFDEVPIQSAAEEYERTARPERSEGGAQRPYNYRFDCFFSA